MLVVHVLTQLNGENWFVWPDSLLIYLETIFYPLLVLAHYSDLKKSDVHLQFFNEVGYIFCRAEWKA